jgi:hypothetical protein
MGHSQDGVRGGIATATPRKALAMNQLIDRYDVGVERGPEWLFVKLFPPETDAPRRGGDLGHALWNVAREHGTNRMVVELDGIGQVDDRLLEGLEALARLILREGGLVRLCGLDGPNLERYESCRLAEHLPHFSCRCEAVGAGSWEFARPAQPR